MGDANQPPVAVAQAPVHRAVELDQLLQLTHPAEPGPQFTGNVRRAFATRITRSYNPGKRERTVWRKAFLSNI